MIRLFLLGYLLSIDAMASTKVTRPSTGFGGVANNLMGPVSLMSDFIYTGCLVFGASFLFASIVKYIDHRRSPLAVPISTVIFLLIAGLLFLALPFTYLITESGNPYSLFR